MKNFKIIIIGGGHAGLEAACISKQFVDDVALITLPNIGIASAPCNPSIGGVGKGQVVRELDALGGVMPELADLAGIQYRVLNESKGYAVQSTRVQIDKEQYSVFAEEKVKDLGIEVIRSKVTKIQVIDSIYHITTQTENYTCEKLIMTVGTFLKGKLHIGLDQVVGGRSGSESVDSLTDIFSDIKLVPTRFKTGTPARLNINSINFDKVEEQPSDSLTDNFYYKNYKNTRNLSQVSCYLTRTNEDTLKIIRDNKERSPMYNGQISGVGARYCPSIEDKAYRYPDKNIHHVFLEPEGLNLNTVYPSGISTSLPKDAQQAFINTINGLENAVIEEYGYAVEYEVIDTTQLDKTLELIDIPGLYFAGQVNGTSGYEEAAAQGFVAGLNACLAILKRDSITFDRNDCYIGVLIQDLVSNVRDEPYRLFTARSENRLFIREDNAMKRMMPYRKNMLLNTDLDAYQDLFLRDYNLLNDLCDSSYFHEYSKVIRSLDPDNQITKRINLRELLKQSWLDPVFTLNKFIYFHGLKFKKNAIKAVAVESKYNGYINRSNQQLIKVLKLDNKKISWSDVIISENVSYECKQRITKIRPETFGELRRIDGLRAASISSISMSI
jgi:tRNA uridine 5-carboxymethylaminomethyl modification enzyme